LYLKKCVIYNSVLEDNFLYNLVFKKIFYTYVTLNCTVLYEMHSGKFIQQLMKVKVFKYFQHSN